MEPFVTCSWNSGGLSFMQFYAIFNNCCPRPSFWPFVEKNGIFSICAHGNSIKCLRKWSPFVACTWNSECLKTLNPLTSKQRQRHSWDCGLLRDAIQEGKWLRWTVVIDSNAHHAQMQCTKKTVQDSLMYIIYEISYIPFPNNIDETTSVWAAKYLWIINSHPKYQ